jgi:hypothetical protein
MGRFMNPDPAGLVLNVVLFRSLNPCAGVRVRALQMLCQVPELKKVVRSCATMAVGVQKSLWGDYESVALPTELHRRAFIYSAEQCYEVAKAHAGACRRFVCRTMGVWAEPIHGHPHPTTEPAEAQEFRTLEEHRRICRKRVQRGSSVLTWELRTR